MLLDKLKNSEISIFRLLQDATDVLIANFFNIIMAVLIVSIPINILSEIVLTYIYNIGSSLDLNAIMKDTSLYLDFLRSNEYAHILIYDGLLIIINLFLAPLSTMAVAYIVKGHVYGEKISFSQALLKAFEKGIYVISSGIVYIAAFAGVGLIIFLGVFLGVALRFLLFISSFIVLICIIFLAVTWYFYIYAIALSDKKTFSSLKYSARLIKNKWFKSFMNITILFIFNYMLTSLVSTIFVWGTDIIFVRILISTLSSLVITVLSVTVTLWYMNLEFVYFKK